METKDQKKLESKEIQDLFEAILKTRTKEEVQFFLRDLLTMKEIESFAMRWKAAQMLDKGISYLEIERETGLSSATIARVSEYLKYGYDGYRLVLNRTKSK